MVFQERLLQRIRNQESPPAERDPGSLAQEVNSIIEHLQRLLNTRQGSVPIRPDYGVPDFSHLTGETFTDIALEMQQSLRKVLETFEPRLTRIQVGFDPRAEDPTLLRFRIEGVLARDERVPLTLETSISPEGRASVNT